MTDRRPKHPIESFSKARDRNLLLARCVEFRKAKSYAKAKLLRAEAAAAADEIHPPKQYRYPTMYKIQGDFRLKVVEAEVEDSQIIVVVGKKGTGKTTFLNMLAETMDIGEDYEMIPKFNVSFKPQELTFLFKKKFIRQTVGYLLHRKIRKSGMNPEFVHNVMEPLHLLMDKAMKDLSPGQWQSVALCLCLGKFSFHLHSACEDRCSC